MKCSFDQQRHNSIANLHETQINMLTALIPINVFSKTMHTHFYDKYGTDFD